MQDIALTVRTGSIHALVVHHIIPLSPYEVPVRVAVGLLPAAHFHDLVNRVREGGLESDWTAPWSPWVAHGWDCCVLRSLRLNTPTYGSVDR